MKISLKNYLSFITISTVFEIISCGQYQDKGEHNIVNEEEAKYPYQPYGFGYDIEDGYGNKQWRHEKSDQPSHVIGSYGFKDKDGIMREVEYIADKGGFRARIKTNEPGTAPKDPARVRFEAQPVMVESQPKQGAYGGDQNHVEPNIRPYNADDHQNTGPDQHSDHSNRHITRHNVRHNNGYNNRHIGYNSGHNDGYNSGHNDGYNRGEKNEHNVDHRIGYSHNIARYHKAPVYNYIY